MISGKRWLCHALVVCLSAGALAVAQDKSTAGADANRAQDIATLRAMIAAQQKQLDALKDALDKLQKSLDATAAQKTAPPSAGQVASIAPSSPPAGSNPCEAPVEQKVPTFIRIGDTCLVPIGFMDLTSVWRSKDVGSSIGTSFANIPYNNVIGGRESEFHFSPQNSRIGFRFDGNCKGSHFIGYNEIDFNGTSGGNNLTVTNGSFVPRIRLFWFDIRKGSVELLAGQSWSMLTPNRKGLSALPGDLFYGQEIDLNYLTGLTWDRQPGVRVILHPSDKFAIGVSLENPEQYVGGSSGGPAITLPSALSSYVS